MYSLFIRNAYMLMLQVKKSVCDMSQYLEVVKNVTDEWYVAHPLLQRALTHLFPTFELLLQAVEEIAAEHAAIVLLGLSLLMHMDNCGPHG